MKLQGKVALVTGAAQGIGLATARLFLEEGASVVIADVNGPLAAETAQTLAPLGPALALQADVSKLEDCEKAVAAAVEKFGKLDILVNNAGIARDNLLLRMSEASWDLVLDINLKGAFHCTKAALRPMLKARFGRIVNIASLVGQAGHAGQANYAASKGGLISLTKSCALELASRDIRVNAVAPGFIRTPMTDAAPEEEKTRFAAAIPLGRIGEPIDIARAVLFLACEDSAYITGHVLNVNGGSYL